MKKILPLLAVLSLATACIYPYQPDLEEAPEGVLVVDGNLVLGEMSTVYVGSMSSLWPGPDDARPKIPVKRVWAEDDAGGVYEGTISSDGQTDAHIPMTKYVLHTENAPVGHNYRVCVNTDDALYTSDWIKPLTPPVIKKINFRANLNDVMVSNGLSAPLLRRNLAVPYGVLPELRLRFQDQYRHGIPGQCLGPLLVLPVARQGPADSRQLYRHVHFRREGFPPALVFPV